MPSNILLRILTRIVNKVIVVDVILKIFLQILSFEGNWRTDENKLRHDISYEQTSSKRMIQSGGE
jgi:hypothetical protein